MHHLNSKEDYFNLDPNICDDCHTLLDHELEKIESVLGVPRFQSYLDV